MLGRKLAERLAHDGAVAGMSITQLTLADIVAPTAPAGAAFDVETRVADLSRPGVATDLVTSRPDVVFQLAAVVSGEAEADFDKGYRINLDGMRLLLEAIRAAGSGYCPRLVFTSSIAVFGAPFPELIDDHFHLTPLTSYGTQKAIGELLLCDYTRRGIVDGVGIRLPTICVRPGAPNKAASGFFSNIIREPLNARQAVLPVADDVRHPLASPRSAIANLVHAAGLAGTLLGDRRCLTMPGLSVTVAEQIAGLREVAGDGVADLIRREPDPVVAGIVAGWPRAFDTARADALGFRCESRFTEIIDVYVADELGGVLAGAGG